MRGLALIAAVLLVSCGSLKDESQSGALAGARDRHIVDVDGGWSLDAPSSWFDRPSAQHGREIMSYDPTGMDNSGNTPPPGGIFFRLQMQQNPDRLDAAAFLRARGQGTGNGVLEHSQLVIAGQPAEFYLVRQPLPLGMAHLEQTLSWYLRSPFFDDRMVVISAVPGDSQLRAEVERIVASLRFARPAAVNLMPTISRADALARVLSRPGLAVDRIEAKLVLYKELEATNQFGRSGMDDPDSLVWVVVYSGKGIPNRFLGPPPMTTGSTQTPEPCVWAWEVFHADTSPGSTGFGCNPRFTWPEWFAGLPDHS
ncbi:MAG: hypothetical protein AUI15_37570 [Actinobacteria bacterium 13_2_20CM_2_66_6]|nr:MAG: hypothetical protein AUI15_37570 [Actinobacteria bacterium 13_2_20CM_2_66_6]